MIKLNASSFEDATAALQSQLRTTASSPVSYSIQEQKPLNQPQLVAGLMNASGALIACLIALAVADRQLRYWLKR